MHIVATGMHHRLLDPVAVGLPGRRGIGETGLLTQRQAVHVGADHDCRAVTIPQDGDDARTAHARGDVIAERRKLCGHPRGGLHLEARQFRIAVEMVEQGGEVQVVVALDCRLERVLRDHRPTGQYRRHGRRHQKSHRSFPRVFTEHCAFGSGCRREWRSGGWSVLDGTSQRRLLLGRARFPDRAGLDRTLQGVALGLETAEGRSIKCLFGA